MAQNTCDPESHEWNMDNQSFLEQAAKWHETGNAPEGHSYVSGNAVHYWVEDNCARCGAKRMLSGVFDRKGATPLPDDVFLWLTIFITRLNESTGHIEEQKQLIHYALEQMPWEHFPKIKMRHPEVDSFEISFRQNKFKKFQWNYRDAYLMFQSMNELAKQYIPAGQVPDIDSPFTDLEKLKFEYRTLMEIATQSGFSAKIQDEMDTLRKKLKELTYALSNFL